MNNILVLVFLLLNINILVLCEGHDSRLFGCFDYSVSNDNND